MPLNPTKKLRIRSLLQAAKDNPKSQKTRAKMTLLTQTGWITPQAAASALVDKRQQIDQFVDRLLFG